MLLVIGGYIKYQLYGVKSVSVMWNLKVMCTTDLTKLIIYYSKKYHTVR